MQLQHAIICKEKGEIYYFSENENCCRQGHFGDHRRILHKGRSDMSALGRDNTSTDTQEEADLMSRYVRGRLSFSNAIRSTTT